MSKKGKKRPVQVNIGKFEERVGYKFNAAGLLIEALTHSSYANEHKYGNIKDNERLEFLGDTILDLIISEYLYKKHPELPEGDLSKLRASIVCEQSLAKVAKTISLGEFLLLGKGEETTGGRDRISVLADAFEAVIGSIYLDGGFKSAEVFVHSTLVSLVESSREERIVMDYKTHLQEYIQKTSNSPLSYHIISEEGPDHDKHFNVELRHEGIMLGNGSGRSKKEAEQNAAYNALEGKINSN